MGKLDPMVVHLTLARMNTHSRGDRPVARVNITHTHLDTISASLYNPLRLPNGGYLFG